MTCLQLPLGWRKSHSQFHPEKVWLTAKKHFSNPGNWSFWTLSKICFSLCEICSENWQFFKIVQVFRNVSTLKFHKITNLQTDKQTLGSTWDSWTIPFLFDGMFTQCLKTCLHHVFRHFLTIYHVYAYVYAVLEDMFTQYLRTW